MFGEAVSDSYRCHNKTEMRNIKKIFFFGIASFLVFLVVVRQVDIADITGVLKSLNWKFSVAAFFLYVAANILRALRFDLILGNRIGFWPFLKIVFFQNFYSTFLPFRLGELSYIHMVNKNNINIGHNIASLIGARVMDLLSIIIIFTTALLFSYKSIPDAGNLFLLTAGLIIVSIIFGIIFIFYSRNTANFLESKLSKTRFYDREITRYLFEKFKEIANGFSNFKKEKSLSNILALSLAVWISIYFGGFVLIRGIGIELNLWQTFFVYGFPILIGLTPFFIFGGLGIYEGSVIFGLLFFGISRGTAAAVGLILHAQELLFVVILAAMAFIISAFLFKKA